MGQMERGLVAFLTRLKPGNGGDVFTDARRRWGSGRGGGASANCQWRTCLRQGWASGCSVCVERRRNSEPWRCHRQTQTLTAQHCAATQLITD